MAVRGGKRSRGGLLDARRGGFGWRRCDVVGWGKHQRGRASGGWVNWRPGGAGRAARGQLAAREIAGAGATGGAAVK
jgi:hypothetical protein